MTLRIHSLKTLQTVLFLPFRRLFLEHPEVHQSQVHPGSPKFPACQVRPEIQQNIEQRVFLLLHVPTQMSAVIKHKEKDVLSANAVIDSTAKELKVKTCN